MDDNRVTSLLGALFFFLLIMLCASVLYATVGNQWWPFNQGRLAQPLPTQVATTGTTTPQPTAGRTPSSAMPRAPSSGGVSSQDLTPTPPGCPAPQTSAEISTTLASGATAIKQIPSYRLDYAVTRTVGSATDNDKSRVVVYLHGNNAERWTFNPPNRVWIRDVIRVGNQVWLGDITGFTPPIPINNVQNPSSYTDYSAPNLWDAIQPHLSSTTYDGVDAVDGTPAYRYLTAARYSAWIDPSFAVSGRIWLDACSKVPLKMDLSAQQSDQSVQVTWRLTPGAVTITPP